MYESRYKQFGIFKHNKLIDKSYNVTELFQLFKDKEYSQEKGFMVRPLRFDDLTDEEKFSFFQDKITLTKEFESKVIGSGRSYSTEIKLYPEELEWLYRRAAK